MGSKLYRSRPGYDRNLQPSRGRGSLQPGVEALGEFAEKKTHIAIPSRQEYVLGYYKLIPGKYMTTVRPVAVKLDSDIRSRIQELAKARDRTPHYLMREAVSQYVEREERREAMRQDALRAWAAYQESGLHVTHDEADAWMAELETGNDVGPPECHD